MNRTGMRRCNVFVLCLLSIAFARACTPAPPGDNGGGDNANDNSAANVNDNDNGGGDGDPVEMNRVTFDVVKGYGQLVTSALGVGVIVGDDALPDVVIVGANTAGADAGAVRLFTNDGAGRFPTVETISEDTGLDGGTEIVVADLNGDGADEIIVVDAGVPPGTTGGAIILVNGDVWTTTGVLPGSDSNPTDAAVGDIDGDGIPDVLVVTDEGTMLTIYPGVGDGTFGAARTIELPAFVGDIQLADIDGDEDLDLLMSLVSDDAGTALNQAAIFFGNGEGEFGDLATLDAGLTPDQVAAADIDNDGNLDLIVGHLLDAYHLYLGDGEGGFDEARRIAGSGSAVFDVADVDGDGNLDLIGKGPGGANPQILYGDGAGGFPEFQNFRFGPPTSVADFRILDVNDDDAVDLVAVGNTIDLGGVDVSDRTMFVKVQMP